MDSNKIVRLAAATVDGSLDFPSIVQGLLAEGVEYYHVDFAAQRFTFYAADNTNVSAPLAIHGLPAIAKQWDAPALRAAILASQREGQTYPQFCERAQRAGVQSYYAFLSGQRVTYLGRYGDQHTEWFAGADPRNN